MFGYSKSKKDGIGTINSPHSLSALFLSCWEIFSAEEVEGDDKKAKEASKYFPFENDCTLESEFLNILI